MFFLRHVFFFCDYRFSYCMKPSGMCLHINSLPSSAFLKYQTSGCYLPEANLIPLLTFERVHFAKFHFHHSVFPQNTGLGTDILFINWSYIACSLLKKNNNTRLAFVYYQNGMKWPYQIVRNDIACNCIQIIKIAIRYAHVSF